jgi:hypothetical protein
VQVSAASRLVPVAHAAEIRPGSRGNLLRQLLSANVDADLYGKELVRAIINVSGAAAAAGRCLLRGHDSGRRGLAVASRLLHMHVCASQPGGRFETSVCVYGPLLPMQVKWESFARAFLLMQVSLCWGRSQGLPGWLVG